MKISLDGVMGTWTRDAVPAEPPPPVEHPPVEFNSSAFFDYIREHLFWGSLNQSQVDGLNYLGTWLKRAPFTEDVRVEQMAYCLATFQHETASTMLPIAEYGGASTRYAPWYGRGYVQLTWEDNYRKQEEKLEGMDLIHQTDILYHVHQNKELALEPDTSAIISIAGMMDGDFTGKKLDDYINSRSIDYVEARRIVNGTDRAQQIADMAVHYEQALREGLA